MKTDILCPQIIKEDVIAIEILVVQFHDLSSPCKKDELISSVFKAPNLRN